MILRNALLFASGLLVPALSGACTLTADRFEPEQLSGPLEEPDSGAGFASPGPNALAPRGTASPECVDSPESPGCVSQLALPSCDGPAENPAAAAPDCRCPGQCATGQACASSSDCTSQVCGASGCAAGVSRCCQDPTCDDGVRNGTEPLVDCGDRACGLCPIDAACAEDTQCSTGFCQAGLCRVHQCSDGLHNGTETATDCGGSDERCDRCGLGESCTGDEDCRSSQCLNGVCSACRDQELDGDETDVDCGGACGACEPGSNCRLDADCQSGACEAGRCCGGREVDCTRCARRLAPQVTCESTADPVATEDCNRFLDCLADNPTQCPVRAARGCSVDPGGVCNHTAFGGNTGPGLRLADSVLGNAMCAF
jgi:hypothetical protein